MTIEQALAAPAGTVVIIKGNVESFYETWSSYGNCSPYITDGTKTILVFRTSTQVAVGDEITVTGTISVYNEVNQIAQGSTVVIDVAATPDVGGDGDDGDGVSVTYNVADKGYANQTAMTSETVDSVITLTFANGGNNNSPKYYTSGAAIRLYSKNTMTISAADGYSISSIKIMCASGNPATADNAIVENGSVTYESATVTIIPTNAGEDVVFGYNPALTSGHIKVQSVVVVYTAN